MGQSQIDLKQSQVLAILYNNMVKFNMNETMFNQLLNRRVMIIHDNRFGGLFAVLSIALKLMCLYIASIKLIIQISDKSKDLLDEGQIQL